MNKNFFKRVLVVLGGTSGERAVSLDSGKACIKALKKKKYVVSIFDPKFKNFNLINKAKTDVIFNALHGKDGEDGVAQSYFEYLRIPYTHSGVLTSAILMNKIISKKLFQSLGIRSPEFLSEYNINNKELKFPLIIKPVNGGSSYGLIKVNNKESLIKYLNKKKLKKCEMLIEEFIFGRELTVGILEKISYI